MHPEWHRLLFFIETLPKKIRKTLPLEKLFQISLEDPLLWSFLDKAAFFASERAFLEEEKEMVQRGFFFVGFGEALYPNSFYALENPPLLLRCYGKKDVLERLEGGVAFVGTRQPTPYGREIAQRGVFVVNSFGKIVVSGLARGIDTEVHKEALKQGEQVGFIGSGLLELYPAENRSLAVKIAERGLVISEYPLKTPPQPFRFPERNRLIAALSSTVVVVEAAEKSGALITAEWAQRLGKSVFACSFPMEMPSFAGNAFLYRSGKAELLDSWDRLFKEEKKELPLFEKKILKRVSLEELAALWKIPLEKAISKTVMLELEGNLKKIPGGLFEVDPAFLC